MSEAAVAAASGVGYGVFQAFNRRSVAGIRSVYLATFMQLGVALLVLVAASVAAGDLDALARASGAGIAYFVGAGLVHFFCGWTLLNASQARIGAARTSPLLSTTPVFGAAIAAVAFDEVPGGLAWVGIGLVVAGALVVSGRGLGGRDMAAISGRDALFGLGCALAWSVSPILIRDGLAGLDSPLLGVTIGLAAAVALYAVALPFLPAGEGGSPAGTRDALAFKLLAGLVVGIATWGRYAALDTSAVAFVLALSLLSVPTVLVLSPRLMGRHVEQVTAVIWVGAALVIGGSLVLAVQN